MIDPTPMGIHRIPFNNQRDLVPDLLDASGRLRVMPASYYATTTRDERGIFCVQNGCYVLPTVELVERLRELIAGRRAIEIGSGNGVVAEALGIPATDSRVQDDPKYRLVYEAMQQAPITYGPNVVTMDARTAVRHHHPEVVVACWVTHKFSPLRPEAHGNEVGVEEGWIVDRADYIFVGNEKTHSIKPLWRRPYTIEYPPYVYARNMNGSRDFIAVWRKGA